MPFRLKRLPDQVIVITGATSGIGLSTARLAARRGARLALCARSERELVRVTESLKTKQDRITYFAADVANKDAVQALADHAFETFGRIDSWINNAGVGLFGRLTETDMADKRRLFDVNFWGAVYGCRAAIPYLWENGGALINIGWRPPRSQWLLQGAMAAAKESLKAYTHALREELESENSPISVSLILPTSVSTPFYDHARHRTRGLKPMPPLPTYLPQTVARAVLACAEKSIPELKIGGPGWMPAFLPSVPSPTLCEPEPLTTEGNLYSPPDVEGREVGQHAVSSRKLSLRTQSRLHPFFLSFVTFASFFGILSTLAFSRMREARRSEREFRRNRHAAYLENIAA